jgi:hypothetical protein
MIAIHPSPSSPFGRLQRFYRYAVKDTYLILRSHGIREVVRRRGWKFLAGVLAYYLVRDTLIYLVVPLLVARGIF